MVVVGGLGTWSSNAVTMVWLGKRLLSRPVIDKSVRAERGSEFVVDEGH